VKKSGAWQEGCGGASFTDGAGAATTVSASTPYLLKLVLVRKERETARCSEEICFSIDGGGK
jgi:hypothetical protein